MNPILTRKPLVAVLRGPSARTFHYHFTRSLSTFSSPDDHNAKLLDRVRRWTSSGSHAVQQRVDGLVTSANSNFANWAIHLNKLSGYEEIQALKQTVVDNEARITLARQAARDTKVAFDQAATARAASQREVNDLLQRKASWTESDVSRFTALVRADHALEQQEASAKDAVEKAEDDVERALSALTGSILARYHEEQVWSDKIRRLSTYGQLGAMGLNVVVFILAIVLVEPWKRRRLGETFEKRVEELERDHTALVEQNISSVRATLDVQAKILESLVGHGPGPESSPVLAPDSQVDETIIPTVLTVEQRKHLETAAYSAIGGAIGAGVVSVIIHLMTR